MIAKPDRPWCWATIDPSDGDDEENQIVVLWPSEKTPLLVHRDENMPDWEDHLGTELECYDFDGGSDKRADIAYGGSDAYNAIDDFLIAAQEKQRENSNE